MAVINYKEEEIWGEENKNAAIYKLINKILNK